MAVPEGATWGELVLRLGPTDTPKVGLSSSSIFLFFLTYRVLLAANTAAHQLPTSFLPTISGISHLLTRAPGVLLYTVVSLLLFPGHSSILNYIHGSRSFPYFFILPFLPSVCPQVFLLQVELI